MIHLPTASYPVPDLGRLKDKDDAAAEFESSYFGASRQGHAAELFGPAAMGLDFPANLHGIKELGTQLGGSDVKGANSCVHEAPVLPATTQHHALIEGKGATGHTQKVGCDGQQLTCKKMQSY